MRSRFSLPVPAVHRVDSLRESSATALVDAASVDPDIGQVRIATLRTSVFNLRRSTHTQPVRPVDISEGNLLRSPLEGGPVSLPVVQI